jgi:hypothetical protein
VKVKGHTAPEAVAHETATWQHLSSPPGPGAYGERGAVSPAVQTAAQSDLICAAWPAIIKQPSAVHNGGYVCGYVGGCAVCAPAGLR